MKFSQFITEANQGKKILFINCEFKEDELGSRFKNGTFVLWDDVRIDDGVVMVGEKKLTDYQFVFVGTVGERSQLFSCVNATIENEKISHLYYGTPTELNNKLLQTVLMQQNGISQIKTIIASGKTTTAEELVEKLGLPLVSKITDGSQGRGIKKHDKIETLKKVLKDKETNFIFQEFIPNDGDFRLFYIRDKLIYMINRKSTSEKEFRNNTSLGGESENVEVEAKGQTLAKKAQKAMNFDFTGVDLIQHSETKDWYVMEINSAPQFKGDKIPMVLDEIAKIIK